MGPEHRLFRAINRERVSRGLGRLRWEDAVHRPARRHSREMRAAGYPYHTPDDDLAAYFEGLDWSIGGENIGLTARDMDSLMRAFMRSKTHRRNILRKDFTHASVGVVRDADGNRWVTVLFYG